MAKDDKDEGGLIVVATQEGVYGSYRKVGEKFVLTDRKHFSKRWMVDAKADPTRAAQYTDQLKERGGVTRTDEEIEAELAVATGRSNTADTKKIARLEKENAELRAQIENLQVELKNAVDLTDVDTSDAGGDAGGKGDDEGNGEGGDTAQTKPDDAPRARRTRRASN